MHSKPNENGYSNAILTRTYQRSLNRFTNTTQIINEALTFLVILILMNEKSNIRTAVLRQRDSLFISVRETKSAEVCHEIERLIAEKFTCPTVAVYKAMRSELDLGAFVTSAYARGWSVCFPCMVRTVATDAEEPPRMAFYRVPAERYETAAESLIDHPLRCRSSEALACDGYHRVAPHDLDAVMVPLVAFDTLGNRLGYGGGNYDRLLPQLRPDAVILGVAFEEQQVDAIPCEPHDQPLPRIVSA